VGGTNVSDYAPYIVLGVILAILPVVLVVGIVRLLKHRKALRGGWQALDEGRLSEACRVFMETASRNLSFFVGLGKEPFEEALRGLAEVYQESRVVVDLDPIREIRRAIRALEKGSTKTIGEKFTRAGKVGEMMHGVAAGWNIEKLVQEGHALIAALPDLE